MRLAIVGSGRMGKAIGELAKERGHTIQTVVTRLENAGGRALTPERLAGIDVALEFTRPDSVVANLERLIESRVPTVTGTTGWNDALQRVSDLVERQGGSLLYAANFSVGVHLFFRSAVELARSFRGRQEYAVSILEEHHKTKADAPSGTALQLQRQLWAAEPGRRFPITSVRAGDAPGAHTLTYEGPHETVTLSHVTRDRQAFAAGALAGAEWLPGHVGIFRFDEMLFGDRA
jgi:4-hydroxy-tetrahydrodipicolinate reductase